MQRVTITSMRYRTCYRTISHSVTWTDHNEMCNNNFKVLPRSLLKIFSQFDMVWELFATVYYTLPSIFFKSIIIVFFINLSVTRGIPLQIALKRC